jgi:flagellar motor switch protein FliG
MKGLKFITVVSLALLATSWQVAFAASGTSGIDQTKRSAEVQIRNLLEPLLDKYCHDQCKLMTVSVNVDLASPDEVAPGFDDVNPRSVTLAPSSAQVKMLIDEQVGTVSRGQLLALMQQYLDTLDYNVKIDTQITRFPQPVGSASKVAELRERVTKQFRNTVDELFKQFCPDQCLLADYELQTESVNAEEAQYGATGEYIEDAGIALRIKNISATILVDDSLLPDERANILEMARLKTNYFKNVGLTAKTMKFPRPILDGAFTDGIGVLGRGRLVNGRLQNTEQKNTTNSNSNSNSTNDSKESRELKDSQTTNNSNTNNNSTSESNQRQERFEKFEKIERVESGDAVQKELEKFKVFGLAFACAIIALLVFIAMAAFRPRGKSGNPIQRVIQTLTGDPTVPAPAGAGTVSPMTSSERTQLVTKRYEIERITEELMSIFAQQPKVAKHVFSRVLTEEGVETTALYIQIFGEGVVIDMLRDPSLQSDVNELVEFYAKNPTEIPDDDKLELLRKLHNRTVAGKLVVMGSRSSHLFEFLSEMDGLQILDLVKNESLTVKSIVLTQCDAQKRSAIYAQLDPDTRMKLLTELSRIDYLPRDYIFNVANALKRKRRENPKLNTEALPGSDVLVNLLERTGSDMARTVMRNLEISNPDSARAVKSKLVSLDTLRFLRDGQLLEVVLSLRHDELLQFLKGAPETIRMAVFTKSPKDLVTELEDELAQITVLSRETYTATERKVLNRMKVMANDGLINLVETNERMLAENRSGEVLEAGPAEGDGSTAPIATPPQLKKVAGW